MSEVATAPNDIDEKMLDAVTPSPELNDSEPIEERIYFYLLSLSGLLCLQIDTMPVIAFIAIESFFNKNRQGTHRIIYGVRKVQVESKNRSSAFRHPSTATTVGARAARFGLTIATTRLS